MQGGQPHPCTRHAGLCAQLIGGGVRPAPVSTAWHPIDRCAIEIEGGEEEGEEEEKEEEEEQQEEEQEQEEQEEQEHEEERCFC